ncbi:TPA: hypothetical protein L5T32_005844 [Pseudomonas aeruginosa]|nr:hypothetical protein [Pseudomonas aeruginosa]
MKASKPGPKPSGKAKSAAQRMREYRARKAEEALGAEHSDKEREVLSGSRHQPNLGVLTCVLDVT